MRTEVEIIAKTSELHVNVQIIEERIREELAVHYRERDYRLLRFLYKEKSVWEFALSQMKWLMSDNK